MSDCADTLLLELVDLARAQKAALDAGNVDEAMALASKRQILARDIQKNDMRKNARELSGQTFDGGGDTRGGMPDTLRSTVEKILSVDREMMASVRAEMSAISDNLNCIGKLKRYIGNTPVPPGWTGTV